MGCLYDTHGRISAGEWCRAQRHTPLLPGSPAASERSLPSVPTPPLMAGSEINALPSPPLSSLSPRLLRVGAKLMFLLPSLLHSLSLCLPPTLSLSFSLCLPLCLALGVSSHVSTNAIALINPNECLSCLNSSFELMRC